MNEFDLQAMRVGQLTRAEWEDIGRTLAPSQAGSWIALRCRHRVDEFARIVMHEALQRAGTGVVSEPNQVDAFVYLAPPKRKMTTTPKRLLMTGRGIGKTMRLKIRALHALLYGLSRFSVVIAATDTDSKGWLETLVSWVSDPLPVMAMTFPKLAVKSTKKTLYLDCGYGCSILKSRSITGTLRGLNEVGVRPDRLYLDDIDVEERSMTKDARDTAETRLTSKVIPMVPIEGGAEVWWVQTPVHPDAVAVRAWKGSGKMQGWQTRRLPVVISWPDADELWAENRAIYTSAEYGDDLEAATEAAHLHYLEHAEEMSHGATVLDEQRLPIDAAYRLRWDVGESAWSTEYDIRPRAEGSSVFEPDSWPVFTLFERSVLVDGADIPLSTMEIHAHYDPSDGGDDGALAVVGKYGGRWYMLELHRWASAKLSVQIAGIPRVIKRYVQFGLECLQWEPVPGAASTVGDAIEASLLDEGVQVYLEQKPSTKSKNARIIGTIEPKGANGRVLLKDDEEPSTIELIASFDPDNRNNRDDVLDAMQRAIERCDQSQHIDLTSVQW